MGSIPDNLQAVKARIASAARAAGRDPGAVSLLAVSKTHPAARVEAAVRAGQLAFGENYVQEALDKMTPLAALPLEWHLVGPLQSNKTRPVAERFDWVHSIDREKLARRLSEQRPAGKAPLNVLIQVNASGESSKSGVAPEETSGLAAVLATMKNLRLRGLMAIPEPGAPAERYRRIGELYERLRGEHGLDTLSLGMSEDLEAAIAAGSTMVRIGTAIFGPRARVRDAA
ncbi:MAG: YggS family pyridoxal phosphate-dependent enzyme [Burkholderiales bacterium]